MRMGRPRGFDEAAAVARAEELFAAHGYDGTSVDDLVRGLGIHRGSLYSAFGSKRALYLRVLRNHVDRRGPGETDDGAGDLTLLLRAAVERAPVDAEAAALVRAGLGLLEARLTHGAADDGPPPTLAQVLGEEIIRRAAGPGTDIEENP
jgi:TetR/AcrR family transcriptional regulator, transcriptional repressor for nem operon